MTVWKIEVDGSSYLEPILLNVAEMLKEMDLHSYYKITKHEIDVDEFNKLPEFRGF